MGSTGPGAVPLNVNEMDTQLDYWNMEASPVKPRALDLEIPQEPCSHAVIKLLIEELLEASPVQEQRPPVQKVAPLLEEAVQVLASYKAELEDAEMADAIAQQLEAGCIYNMNA